MPSGLHVCPECGSGNRGTAKFCDTCGSLLRQVSAPAEPQPSEDELKYVTVLFADIVGSTELVAGQPAEEAQAILMPAVTAMTAAVQAFGGSLNTILGDGVMALFGVPFSQEDHASRACCAAFRMHAAVALLNPPIKLRIGIASGQTLLTTSTAAAGAYPAFGVTIHRASRLQTIAKPGTTLCAESTRALINPSIQLVPLGPQALRGLGKHQSVFAVTGVDSGGVDSGGVYSGGLRFGGPARGLSPHVGREKELSQLTTCAQAVEAGTPATVLIVGDAGAGKSRLAWEFTHRLPKTWRVVQAEAVSYGRDVPYQLIGTLLRSVLSIDARAEADASVGRVRSRLTELDYPADFAPALLSLLALPLGDDAGAWDALDPQRRRDMLRDGVGTLLTALARHDPALLLIEDLQWADDQSLRLLDVAAANGTRLLVLATHRPDFVSPWTQPAQQVALHPLSSDSMGQLLQQAFPCLTSPALRDVLIERSAGNPFFLEELSRDALATAMPVPGVHTGVHTDGPGVPSTIQAIIAARIDRLDPAGKRLLVTASALGNLFSRQMLQAIAHGVRDAVFQGQVQALCDAGLLRTTRELHDEVRFGHALIQEVAYSGLPRTQRRNLHRNIVRMITRSQALDRVPEQAETLAYHAARGEAWEDLIVAARIAGRRAASRSAYSEAARFFTQAIDACGKLPPEPQTLTDEIDLRFELRSSLFPTAGISSSLDNSTRAERLAQQLGDRHRLGWATAYVARDLQLVGRPGESMATAARAHDLADGDHHLITAAAYFSGHAAYALGNYAMAATTLQGLIDDLEVRDPTAWTGVPGPSIIFYRCWLIWSLARLGRHADAAAAAAEMRRLADEARLPLARTIAHLCEGFAWAHAGHLPEAEATLRVSLSLCRKWELFGWSTNILSCLGHVLCRRGQFDEGLDMLGQAIERTRTSGILVSHANELAWLAEAHRGAGRPGIAIQHATEAVEVARQHEERGNEALATLVLGEALADEGSADLSRTHIAAALCLAIETGMVPLINRCRAGLAGFNGGAMPGQGLIRGYANARS